MDKICNHCSEKFETKSGNTKFCPECQFVTFNCDYCNTPKTIKRIKYERPDTSGNYHFCSRKCATDSKIPTRGAAKARENKVSVICPECGALNKRKYAHRKRLFCDRSCFRAYARKHPEKYLIRPLTNPETVKKVMATRKRNKSNWMLGKHAEKHPRWKGGKVQYRGPSWSDARLAAISRDGFLCISCSVKPGSDVHHIIAFRKFRYKAGENRNDIDANHIDNLIFLCHSCHAIAENSKNSNIPKGRILKAKRHFNNFNQEKAHRNQCPH